MSDPDFMTHPRIYNLFPRLVGDLQRWLPHVRRASDMGFNWIYINPIHLCGFSGSCYAIKDLDRVDPLLLPQDHPDARFDDERRGEGGMDLLKQVLHDIHGAGMHWSSSMPIGICTTNVAKSRVPRRSTPPMRVASPSGGISPS